jgi:hypothetical protein
LCCFRKGKVIFCGSFKLNEFELFRKFIYEPAKGDPNIPTASSAQIRKNASKITIQRIILFAVVLTFRKTSSQIKLVPERRIPITTKSNRVQFTSSVNCIAINGISNKKAHTIKKSVNLLNFIILCFWILFFCICNIEKP